MIAVMIAAAMVVQAGGSNDPRREFVSCLSEAVSSAKGANVGVDGFKDYARRTCATVEGGFKAKLVSFNVKNGMSKAAAAKDADVQLEDYVYTAEERYRYSFETPK